MTVTADLYDERGEDLASIETQFLNFGGATRFEGVVRTVKCFEDNLLIRETISTPGNGAVLVIDAQGSLGRAVMGDNLAEIALSNGWAGVVINGAVRDRVELGKLNIGIKALGSNPRKSTKTGAGEVDIPVVIADVTIRPGDYLWSDEDGILVEPKN